MKIGNKCGLFLFILVLGGFYWTRAFSITPDYGISGIYLGGNPPYQTGGFGGGFPSPFMGGMNMGSMNMGSMNMGGMNMGGMNMGGMNMGGMNMGGMNMGGMGMAGLPGCAGGNPIPLVSGPWTIYTLTRGIAPVSFGPPYGGPCGSLTTGQNPVPVSAISARWDPTYGTFGTTPLSGNPSSSGSAR